MCGDGMKCQRSIVAYLLSFRNINLNIILAMYFMCNFLIGMCVKLIQDLCDVWLFETTSVIEPEEITESQGFSSFINAAENSCVGERCM